MSSPHDISATIQRLKHWFSECPGTITAFSGGVDSSLVAFLARHFLGPERSLAAISASPTLKTSEFEEAKKFASTYEIRLQIVTSGELENPNYFNNPTSRCYYCKDALYRELEKTRKQHPQWWVINGQNHDDVSDDRPGILAASEHAVRAPLAECEIDKETVRAIAAHFKLTCWNKPIGSCLASRIPYGERVTVEKLRQVEAAEAALKEQGFPLARVRHHGEHASIEVPQDQIATLYAQEAGLATALKAIGFEQIKIDCGGFASEKLNRAMA